MWGGVGPENCVLLVDWAAAGHGGLVVGRNVQNPVKYFFSQKIFGKYIFWFFFWICLAMEESYLSTLQNCWFQSPKPASKCRVRLWIPPLVSPACRQMCKNIFRGNLKKAVVAVFDSSWAVNTKNVAWKPPRWRRLDVSNYSTQSQHANSWFIFVYPINFL